jgi:hypothetical protein
MAEQCEKARGVRESRLGSEDAEDAAHCGVLGKSFLAKMISQND